MKKQEKGEEGNKTRGMGEMKGKKGEGRKERNEEK